MVSEGLSCSPAVRNVCAGPFGAVYDFYIERPRLARAVLAAMWGVDPRPFYDSLQRIAQLPDGASILDVPCGGGVALRGLRPDQRASWIGVDIESAMLTRTRRRAQRFPQLQLQLIQADMSALPLEDQSIDLCLSYGGLHCVPDPQAALAEMARCLREGAQLVGSTFLAQGTRRHRRLLESGDFGHIGSAADLKRWLSEAGLRDVTLDREDGLALFSARRL
ncbi:MAG: class I SAM-dependent methyltransferase [Solirubrobacteraceae bacterium]